MKRTKPIRFLGVFVCCGTVVADFLDDVTEASRRIDDARMEDILGSGTLTGSSLVPFFQRFILPKDEFQTLLQTIRSAIHWEDMALMAFIGWATVPSIRWPYQHIPVVKLKPQTPFRNTAVFLIADHLQQIARIALLVYFVDIFKMLCIGFGLDFCRMKEAPNAFAQIAYTVWLAQRFATAKKLLLRQYVTVYPETFGRMQIINRLGNAALITLAGFLVLNILKVKMGVAMSSFLALGSISTLALGIASQGIFSQILNGLLLVSSDRIYEGDYVRWGNKLEGTIVKLGWIETIVRGSDEVMVSVPNNDLVRQQVSNLSRVRFSQVTQSLRFKLRDADEIPSLLETIKKNIVEACPYVITDGSRPFRVVWTGYGPDFLEVDVDVRIRIKPIGEEYWIQRQRILQAIRRAVKMHELSFAKE